MPFPSRRHLRLLALAPLLCASQACAEGRQIDAYNTYLYPPFVNEDGSGIAADLVARLNAHLADYTLVLRNVPRRRLMMLDTREPDKFDGVGLLLASAFINDEKQPRFLWSDPVFHDYNVLVFAGKTAPPVASAADLKDKRLGAILGNRYLYLEHLVQAGSIVREDTTGERLNLRKLIGGRVDFTQMNRLLYGRLSAEPEFAGKLAAIAEPGMPPFIRRLFVGPHQAELLDKLNVALAALPCDKQWRATANRHSISLPACQPASLRRANRQAMDTNPAADITETRPR